MKAVLAVLCTFSAATIAVADPFRYSWEEVAPGIHAGVRAEPARTPVMGTTVIVVGDTGVIVFDGGGVPLMSERAIAYIRGITELPVTHVVISHWHQDHSWGIAAFVRAFPAVQVISHPYTRAELLRRNPDAERRSRTAIAEALPGLIARLASGELPDHERRRLSALVEDADAIDSEYQRLETVAPDLTVDGRLVIHSGDRAVELLHLGRGNTAGDLIMWVPDAGVVATGDLVVAPTPFGFGSYAGEWAETLKAVRALSPAVLVPGHGPVQRDTRYLDLLVETLELVARQMEALVAEGADEAAAVAALDFSSVEERFTGGDAFLAGRFDAWFKRPVGRAAYRVAVGLNPEVE